VVNNNAECFVFLAASERMGGARTVFRSDATDVEKIVSPMRMSDTNMSEWYTDGKLVSNDGTLGELQYTLICGSTLLLLIIDSVRVGVCMHLMYLCFMFFIGLKYQYQYGGRSKCWW
jgi:hypothetical protein